MPFLELFHYLLIRGVRLLPARYFLRGQSFVHILVAHSGILPTTTPKYKPIVDVLLRGPVVASIGIWLR